MRALLSPSERSVLAALRRRPATVAALARCLPHLRPQTIYRAAVALIGEGIVARRVQVTLARYPARGTGAYVYRFTGGAS